MNTNPRTAAEVAIAVDALIAAWNERFTQYARAQGEHYPISELVIAKGGRKFIKVQTQDTSGEHNSAYAFINARTGEVFRPAGRDAPAKHARGNVLDRATWGCFGPHGVSYLTSGGALAQVWGAFGSLAVKP